MIGIVLLVAILVLLSGLFFISVMNQASVLKEPAPLIGQTSAELVSEGPGGSDDQIVRIDHIAGDEVEVSDIYILVELPNGNSAKIVGMAGGSEFWQTDKLDSDDVEKDNIIDLSAGATKGSISSNPPDTDGVWSPGDFIEFRIKESGDGMDLKPGDRVSVRIVHIPSGSTIVSEEIRVG